MKLPSAGIALVLILAGCNATKPPPQLTMSGSNCAARADLSVAQPLVLDAKDDVSAGLDSNSPCLQADDGASTYAVFRLPDHAEPYLIVVTSAPVGDALFAPRLLVLDGDGNLMRELGRDRFLFHGATLAGGFRPAPNERYLIVALDPGSVGKQVPQVVGSVQMQTVSSGLFVFQTYTGSETTRTLVYAYNGTITVSAKSVAMSVKPSPRVY